MTRRDLLYILCLVGVSEFGKMKHDGASPLLITLVCCEWRGSSWRGGTRVLRLFQQLVSALWLNCALPCPYCMRLIAYTTLNQGEKTPFFFTSALCFFLEGSSPSVSVSLSSSPFNSVSACALRSFDSAIRVSRRFNSDCFDAIMMITRVK